MLHRAEHGDLPIDLPRRNVLGPTQLPLAVPTARTLQPEALLRVARGIDVAVATTGMLPSRIRCGEGTLGSAGELGLGSALVALGRALTSANPADAVVPVPVAPYPPEGDDIAGKVRAFRDWRPHRRDLDMAPIARLAALQAWTLKPAVADD